jgi:hypothetical protein
MMDGVDTAEDPWIFVPGDHALASTVSIKPSIRM